MEDKNNFQVKVISAAKWSTITQIAAKLVSPVTNIILARILTPEAFGVVATVTMIISFAEMFTDSGFQKYLVQQEFENEYEKYNYANVAFWTNLLISLILWLVILIFSEPLAILVGSPGLGNVLVIASLQLPLTSFSSIQMALYRRDFDFKTLFLVRIIGIIIPFLVTIPLSLVGLNYWALIIGTLTVQLSNAVLLTFKSNWKPKLFYSFNILKKMLSFSIWSLIEAISIWLSTWIDSFIIASSLSQYELGIYKTSTTMVNTLMSLITASVIPVLFSTLSRLQSNNRQFKAVYYKFQRFVSLFVFPIGIGVYLYSDLATEILLGNQWADASGVLGIWALTYSIKVVFGHFSSEVYRSKGKPKLSFLAQCLHLIVLIPVCIISSKFGFWPLVYTRSWIQMQFVLVHFIVMKHFFGFSVIKTINNILPTALSSIIMAIFVLMLKKINNGILWDFISIFFSVIFYFSIVFLFPNMHNEIFRLFKKIKQG